MVRLVRALRLSVKFRTLWRLVQGLRTSGGTMIWTLLLLIMMLYVFSCIAVEFITKDETLRETLAVSESTSMIMQENFASIGHVMLTFLQFATLDSIAAVYAPIVRARPSLMLLFAPIMLIVSITLMNLVTAVIVEVAMDNAKEDKDMLKAYKRHRLRSLKPDIQRAFQAVDLNEDHILTKHEFLQQARRHLPEVLLKIMGEGDLGDIFDLLDVENSGVIEEEVFVGGVSALVLSEVPVETWQILRLLQLLLKSVRDLTERVDGSG